ncbi:MAG: hypothetical protein ABEH40_00610 [Haloferacaceae archaeon]
MPNHEALLWMATGVLFLVMAVAAVLPVRPMVWILPLWGVAVAAAMLAGVAAGAAAALRGWPSGGERA